jgi:dienelactone hydrolase
MNQQKIQYKSGGIDIDAELFSPAAAKGKQPLVVIAYGTGGMVQPFGPMYLRFAEGLARAGFFTLLPDYLARTKTPHNLEMLSLLPACGAAWASALGDAVDNAVTHDQVDDSRVALCGFSLGGNLMMHVAQTQRTNAFVDYFAPTVTIDPTSVVTEAMASNLPTTLIHHGDKDKIVPLSDSEQLKKWLTNAKIECKLIPYEKQGHPSLNDSSSWSVKSQDASLLATIAFLQARL